MTTGLYIGVYSGGNINWQQRADYPDITQISISDGIGAMGDTMTIPMLFPTAYTDNGNELPLAGQLVRLVINNVKLFEGIMPTIGNSWGPNSVSINTPIVAASYASLLNSKLAVVNNRPEEKAGVRVKYLLTNFAPSFALNLSYIEEGEIVSEESYDYQNVASVISKLASQIGYMWYVDFDMYVHFYSDLNKDAPITTINADTDIVVGDLDIKSDSSNIINIVILKDYSSKSSNSQSYTNEADGAQSFFALPMPPFSLEDTKVEVSSDGGNSWVQKTLIDDPLDGSDESITGVEGTAYLCTFNWGIRFPTSDLPQSGDLVKSTYSPEDVERVMVVFDEDSIEEFSRREGTDGKHYAVISVSDFRVSSEDPVLMLGKLILSRKAWPVITGNFTIRTTNYGEWAPGQTFTVISTKRDIFDIKTWVSSNYVTKNPMRVWIVSVKRRFEPTLSGIIEVDEIEFSSTPWE